ncbi:MAG: hypothetical protein JNG88_10725 [Phycisphaerales bacterium]|nr:hypothetical protein [Phycisphaerales bacterium]
MSQSMQPFPPNRESRVSTEIACVGCGHLLVGQMSDAVCPECAQPVRWSLYGTSLSAADGQWLRMRYLGASMAIVALPWVWLPMTWIVILVAVWLLTAPNPAQTHTASTSAWIVRAVTVLGFVGLAGLGIYTLIVLVRFTDEIALLSAAAYCLAQAMLTLAIRDIIHQEQRALGRWLRSASRIGLPAMITLLILMALYSAANTTIAAGGSAPRWLIDGLEGLLPLVGGLCGLICLMAVPFFWVSMGLARRRLDQAIIRSDDIRRRVRAWNPWTADEGRSPAASSKNLPGVAHDSPRTAA